MKWNHLPVAGGLNDQDPELLADFRVIFAAKAQWDTEQRKKQEAEMKKNKANSRVGRPRRR